jgi:predicted RNase H-like nuclease (RuvC/YqgF family)
MCIYFGKKAKLLKEENANLKAKVESLTKRAEKAEKSLQATNNEYEKDIKEKLSEITRLRTIVAGRENTINQLKAELDKVKPYRAKNGRFTHKPKNDGSV